MPGCSGDDPRFPRSSKGGEEGCSGTRYVETRHPMVGSRVQKGVLVSPGSANSLQNKGHGVPSPEQAMEDRNWPSIHQSVQGEKKRRLTIAPGVLVIPDAISSSYQPSTKGGRQRLNEQIASEIKQHLFASKLDPQLEELADACGRLEESMNRMSSVTWGCAISKKMQPWGLEREVEDDRPQGGYDSRFSHSWRPIGPGKGWYWIPKGRLSMDITYPARLTDIRKLGPQARKVKPTPFLPLSLLPLRL